MKRFFALAALVLGLASCQTEPEGLDVQMGGEVDATITVNIPDSETRAGGTNSALGVFDNGVLNGNATMRYILQVYYGENASQERLVKYSDDKEVDFDVRLVPGRAYKFVAWADVVDGEADTDKHYNTADLKNVTLKGAWDPMDESRDAFTDVKEVTNFNAASVINLTLTRPFAKLRVKTTDVQEMANIGVVPAYATVEYTTPYRAAFNAFEGHAVDAGSEEKVHSVFEIANYGDNNTNNKILFTDYFFAEEGDAVSFRLDVFEDAAKTKLIKSNNFNTDIAVNRNYLTTIQGNILTDGNNIEVKVEDVFANAGSTDPNYEYKTISSDKEFLAAVNTPGKYIVISNLHIANEGDTITTLATRAAGNTTIIDLNGKTITVENKDNDALASVAAGNTLVITNTVDGGKIELTEGSKGAFIENNGTVVIENGNIKSNSTNDAPVIDNNGTTDITGGVIGNNAVENNETEGGSVNITGGKLEGEGLNDFINDDYTKNENNEIVMKPTIAKIGEVEYRSLQKAFDAVNNGTIEFVGDVTLEETATLGEGKTVTLDLNGKTITGNWHKDNGAVIKNNGTLTIVGGTISSTGENGGSAIQNTGTLTVNNATLNGAPNAGSSWPSYAVNNTGVMTLENTTITSYHGAVASYGNGAVVTLNNCTIDMAGIPGFTSHGIYTYNNGKVVVNGGTYVNKATDQGESGASVINGAVEVNAGTFSGRIENYYGTPVLKGGTFSVKPNPAFVPVGGEVTEANGVWTVSYNPYYDYENVSEGLLRKGNAYVVNNANGLATLNAMMVNKTAGKKISVSLNADIDFTGKTWTPVDSHVDFGFEIAELNGNGHTISNLTINGQAMFTRFAGFGDVTIKDVTFDNANVNSNGNINTSILTVQSYQNVLLDNVDVKNSTIIGGYKVATLIGTVYNESSSTITATLKNCDVENTTVKAVTYDYGTTGMVAFVYEGNNDKIVFDNCSIKNVSLYAPNTNGYELHAAIYMNDKDTDDLINETEGVNVDNVTFTLIQ